MRSSLPLSASFTVDEGAAVRHQVRKLGLEIIRQAVERRWAVTAVLRSPDKLGELAAYVAVAPSSVFDPQVIADAAVGYDAEFNAIGSRAGFLGRGSTTVYSNAAAALVAGCRRQASPVLSSVPRRESKRTTWVRSCRTG